MTEKNQTKEVITLASRVCAKQTVFGTAVDGELILFDPESGTYFGAGAVGQKIWTLIADERAVQAVCEALLEEFSVDRETCETDVLQFLGELHAKGLIHADAHHTPGA